ncbi:MAG: hypothetical protein HDS45_00225 [Bacteroides sp.]|nr:hypothetical protein [Bacteroides sp.]
MKTKYYCILLSFALLFITCFMGMAAEKKVIRFHSGGEVVAEFEINAIDYIDVVNADPVVAERLSLSESEMAIGNASTDSISATEKDLESKSQK